EAAAAIRQRRPSGGLVQPGAASVAAWRSCRGRIEAVDGRLRAWAWVAPAPGGGEAGAGRALGALDGHVVGVKDVLDVGGMPTRAGSPLTSEGPARADAPVVARLRRAGAAIAG